MNTCYQVIGETAGRIYKSLEKNGQQNVAALKKEAGVKDAALFNQAIGWLAREGKLNFEKKGSTFLFSLSEVCAAV